MQQRQRGKTVKHFHVFSAILLPLIYFHVHIIVIRFSSKFAMYFLNLSFVLINDSLMSQYRTKKFLLGIGFKVLRGKESRPIYVSFCFTILLHIIIRKSPFDI